MIHKLVHKICRRLLFFLGKRCIRLGRDGDIVGRMPLNTHRKNIISTKVGKGQVSHFRFAKGSGNQTTIQTFSGWLRILRRLKKTYQFPRPPDTKVTIFRNKPFEIVFQSSQKVKEYVCIITSFYFLIKYQRSKPKHNELVWTPVSSFNLNRGTRLWV